MSALLDSLVAEKLKAEAETIAAEGWKWIEVERRFPVRPHPSVCASSTARRPTSPPRSRRRSTRCNAEYAKLEAEYEDADELPDEVDAAPRRNRDGARRLRGSARHLRSGRDRPRRRLRQHRRRRRAVGRSRLCPARGRGAGNHGCRWRGRKRRRHRTRQRTDLVRDPARRHHHRCSQVDITPREYVLDYLAHSFPVQLYEPFTDSEGNLSSRPVYRDGQPVESREAVARRDRLIEKLASLPPVPGRSTRSCSASAPTWSRRSPAARGASSARATGSWSRTAPARPISPRPPPSWMTTSASSSSPMPAAPGAATTPSCRRGISGCASTTCSNPAGRPTPPSRVWAAPTAPTRRSRRCSGRSRPT